ncbi:hypothetical protein CYMTET_44931 [Cymbomonas tetramitiformis]|uniref:Uncharacterized protein n=1 Tax=Cymbomonas tetramitiformis TaxID=36881 RepID=A0AAE0BZ83_9CHLO|nr:hypothetical protein CYMTET_44931 [Cymbomonas tetramitiformis]
MSQQAEGKGNHSLTNVCDVPAHGSVLQELPQESNLSAPNDRVVSWTMVLEKAGYCWGGGLQSEPDEKDGTKGRMAVVPGGTYRIILDEKNPAITIEMQSLVTALLLDQLQLNTPYEQIWPSLHILAPPDIRGQRTIKQLIDVYDDDVRRPWSFWYKPVVPEMWATPEDLEQALTLGGEARVELYWRALDRFPGGNADLQTVCYTFDCATTSVSCRLYQNWDGSHERSEFQPERLSEELQQKLPPLLRALGSAPRDSECTLLDNHSSNSDEYDTEWSSQEVLVSLPRRWSPSAHAYFSSATKSAIVTFLLVHQRLTCKLDPGVLHRIFFRVAGADEYAPVLRLHRRCILGPQYSHWGRRRGETGSEPEIPPSAEQLRVLEAADFAVGMGRVNTWTDAGDGEDPCPAQEDPRLDEVNGSQRRAVLF